MSKAYRLRGRVRDMRRSLAITMDWLEEATRELLELREWKKRHDWNSGIGPQPNWYWCATGHHWADPTVGDVCAFTQPWTSVPAPLGSTMTFTSCQSCGMLFQVEGTHRCAGRLGWSLTFSNG